MQKNKKITNIFIIVGVVIVLGALFIIPRLTSPERGIVKNWKEADIRCVAEETKLLQHIHPHLSIIIDGEEMKKEEAEGLAFKDKQQIVLEYSKKISNN